MIMKDGDPQQRNEILRALLEIFPNAIEGGCGWHIVKTFHSAVWLPSIVSNILHLTFVSWSVHQGWKAEVPGEKSISK